MSTPPPDPAQNPAENGQTPIHIHAQYIRDLSFENPHAPHSLRADAAMPDLNMDIGMDARKIEDSADDPNMYEVALNVRAVAKRGEETVFIGELMYGILVSVDPEFPQEKHHPLLLIEIPRLAFPFVRQIMMDISIQAGFPPLLLNPIDFQALYMKQFGEQIKKAQEEAAKAAEKPDKKDKKAKKKKT